MNIIMYISSVTGNTRKVAEALTEHLHNCHPEYTLSIEDPSGSGHRLPGEEDADLVILCFWCRKCSLDDRSRKTLEGIAGRRILAFGTMGFYPDSEYGEMLKQNVTDRINVHNTCLGVFTCQGKIPEERTEKRRALPHDQKHWLDDEGYARHLESRKHPNEQDLANAVRFLEEHISRQ